MRRRFIRDRRGSVCRLPTSRRRPSNDGQRGIHVVGRQLPLLLQPQLLLILLLGHLQERDKLDTWLGAPASACDGRVTLLMM
jgi:hypothetical protein